MTRRLLAIDPGNLESAYVVIDADTRRPIHFDKVPNPDLLDALDGLSANASIAHIEMVASYGMPVGAEVFETCVWIGRFLQRLDDLHVITCLTKRQPVKLHHCHHPRATDATVRQALVDRFAPGERNHGKGTKAAPGWFYGFRADVWQAHALAVYAADLQHHGTHTTPEEAPF